jgi:DNA-binding PadR family transcriptional regulator
MRNFNPRATRARRGRGRRGRGRAASAATCVAAEKKASVAAAATATMYTAASACRRSRRPARTSASAAPDRPVGGPFGPGFGGPRGRGRGRPGRTRRRAPGDHLAAGEEPRNGYQIIQEINERTGGLWRVSSGSVYPAIAQLEDEGLIEPTDGGGRKLFALTESGRQYAEQNGEQLAQLWEIGAEDARFERVPALPRAGRPAGLRHPAGQRGRQRRPSARRPSRC